MVGVIPVMSVHNDAGHGAPRAHLVLVEQSGAKQQIPQPSTVEAMIEAQHVIHRLGHHFREVKVISQHSAVARRAVCGHRLALLLRLSTAAVDATPSRSA
jgi:hypothetical protein